MTVNSAPATTNASFADTARARTSKIRIAFQSSGMVFAVGGALVILAVIVVYPLIRLFAFSFIDETGWVSLSTVQRAFDQPGIVLATMNSLKLVLYVTIGCLLLAMPLAWLVTRTDMPLKNLVRLGAALAFILPSFVMVIAWIYLATPNAGKINVALMSMGLIERPLFNIMSFEGLVFIEVIATYPLIFFAVSTALGSIESNFENAARLLGASRLRTTLTVTFPLVLPAIFTGVLLTMLDALSSFGAPAAIGTMANFSVLTTRIYAALTYPPQLELAAAISLPIILFTAICLIAQKFITGGDRYRTVTGKASAVELVRLGRLRWPSAIGSVIVVAMTSFVPFVVLGILSFNTSFGRSVGFDTLTLAHYERVFNSSFPIVEAVQNSLLFGGIAVSACLLLGIITAWVVERTKMPGRTAISFIIMIAYGFPSISFAVAVLLGFIHWMYGTMAIVIIAYVAKKLPVAYVMFRAGMKQISPEFEEAARILGAGWTRSFFTITMPLLRPAAAISALLVFSLCLRELSMSAILTQPGTTVMSVTVLEYIEIGQIEVASAISMLIVVIGLISAVGTSLIARKSGIQR